MKMNGFPNGIPLNEKISDWLKSVHDSSNHANLAYFIKVNL